MTAPQNTLYIDSKMPHLAEALIPLIEKTAPDLQIIDDSNAFFQLSFKEGRITFSQSGVKDDITFPTPIKSTVVIQQIQKSYAQCRPIHIGPYVFDYAARTLNEDKTTLHLTEKEAEVLSYLDKNRNKGITRDDLLKNVWGYADGIDTHTIETHIYRLRQKIEKNPVEADILLTCDDGYQLVSDD